MTFCFLIQQLRTIKQCYARVKQGRSSTPGVWVGTLNLYTLGIQEAHATHLKKILWLWRQKLKNAYYWLEHLRAHFYQQTIHYLKFGIQGHPCKCYHQGPCRSTLLYIYHKFRSITKCTRYCRFLFQKYPRGSYVHFQNDGSVCFTVMSNNKQPFQSYINAMETILRMLSSQNNLKSSQIIYQY